MRVLAVLLVTLMLASCARGPAEQQGAGTPSHDSTAVVVSDQAAPDSTVQFLLTTAATDFHEHRPPDPARFRDVRVGRVPAPGGETREFLYGQFSTEPEGDAAPWTDFVTIRTTPYEHWIGAFASEFHRNPAITWYANGDLSSGLKQKLDALR
ncbi:MAG: hypothetical protein IPJ04_10425 [Candidatus Eisenbacteria bacterium]|nr:hypothetical protein [Candidatus Eisenbacteria bacterium]